MNKVVKITALSRGKGRHARIGVMLDGRQALSLEAEVVFKEGLRVGQEISTVRLDELEKLNRLQCCYDAAIFYLGFRPRSRAELKRQLNKRGFDDVSIAAALKRLTEQKLVDDDTFARFWAENRLRFSPRGRRLIVGELCQKGVDAATAERATAGMDERDAARRAATSRAGRLVDEEYRQFRQKLGQYLRRRGFSYDVIKETTATLWQQMGKERDGREA